MNVWDSINNSQVLHFVAFYWITHKSYIEYPLQDLLCPRVQPKNPKLGAYEGPLGDLNNTPKGHWWLLALG